MFYINPKNILVHSKYNGDHSGGYDIALIGFDSKHDYYKIEQYIYKNQEMLSEEEKQNAKYYFKENNLFTIIYNNYLE